MSNTTSFYSTKRNSNVMINNNKVCGYRIKNPWMKQGFSYGVKAGRDNGVVDQKLSRFATGRECDEAGQRCAGNTNWLNYKKGMGFTKPESSKTQYSLGNRNNFNAGEIGRYPTNVPDLEPNQRKGRGNRLLERVNFMASGIKPRMHFPVESLRTITYGEQGLLTDTSKGLSFKVSVKVPDPNDFAWLREKARIVGKPAQPAVIGGPGVGRPRIPATGLYLRFEGLGTMDEIEKLIEREIELNPPLGRKQRTINKTTNNIAGLTSSDPNSAISKLTKMVKEGRAENIENNNIIVQQFADVLTRIRDLNRLSQHNKLELLTAIQRLKLADNYKEYFGSGQPQLVSWYWLSQGDNLGQFYMYMMKGTNIDPFLTENKPIYNMYKIEPSILAPTPISQRRNWGVGDPKQKIDFGKDFIDSLTSSSYKVRSYIDLHRRALVNRDIAARILNEIETRFQGFAVTSLSQQDGLFIKGGVYQKTRRGQQVDVTIPPPKVVPLPQVLGNRKGVQQLSTTV